MNIDWVIIGIIVIIGLVLLFRWLSTKAKESLEFAKIATEGLNRPTCPVCHSMLKLNPSNYKKSGSSYRQYLSCPNCGHHISVSRGANENETNLEYFNGEIKKDPDNANNWFGKGAVEEKLGHYSAARSSYENAIRLGWDNKIIDLGKSVEKLKEKGY